MTMMINSQHLLSTYYIPNIDLWAFPASPPWNLTTTL